MLRNKNLVKKHIPSLNKGKVNYFPCSQSLSNLLAEANRSHVGQPEARNGNVTRLYTRLIIFKGPVSFKDTYFFYYLQNGKI